MPRGIGSDGRCWSLLDWLDERWSGAVDVQSDWRTFKAGGRPAPGYWFFTGERDGRSFEVQIICDPRLPGWLQKLLARKPRPGEVELNRALTRGQLYPDVYLSVLRIDIYVPAADANRYASPAAEARARSLGYEPEIVTGGVHLVRRDLAGDALTPASVRAALDAALSMAFD